MNMKKYFVTFKSGKHWFVSAGNWKEAIKKVKRLWPGC